MMKYDFYYKNQKEISDIWEEKLMFHNSAKSQILVFRFIIVSGFRNKS